MADLTWEQAVALLRRQPDQQQLVRDCYYDDPLIEAAKRFASSDEWRAVQCLLPRVRGCALDLGAGRGIGSYALAHAGWQVIALEPDPSTLVGTEAIRQLACQSGLPIRVVEDNAEQMPFADDTFDLVYGRQVLHHARDLLRVCREIVRTLKPSGRLVVTREHVISKPEDLNAFLSNHPLHKFYGGEHAYLLREYIAAISKSGLRLLKVLGPFDSAINYFPLSRAEWQAICHRSLGRRIGARAAQILLNEQSKLGRWWLARLGTWYSLRDSTPGRLYSFVAEKSL